MSGVVILRLRRHRCSCGFVGLCIVVYDIGVSGAVAGGVDTAMKIVATSCFGIWYVRPRIYGSTDVHTNNLVSGVRACPRRRIAVYLHGVATRTKLIQQLWAFVAAGA